MNDIDKLYNQMYSKNYYTKNREKIREQQKLYKEQNKDKIKEYNKQYYLKRKVIK